MRFLYTSTRMGQNGLVDNRKRILANQACSSFGMVLRSFDHGQVDFSFLEDSVEDRDHFSGKQIEFLFLHWFGHSWIALDIAVLDLIQLLVEVLSCVTVRLFI